MKRKVHLPYKDIDWKDVYQQTYKIQKQIAMAWRSKKVAEVAEIQYKLTRSFAARALAVRRVVTNSGSKTPGVDRVIWKSDESRVQAISLLKNLKNYKACPVRRIYIPKKDGKLRPLGIPTMFDRAVQPLWTLALEPISESTADSRSYGFRPYHGCHDVLTYLKLVLSSYTGTRRWVMDADSSKFFDTLSHDWVLKNVPMNKTILREILKAGFLENSQWHETEMGTPQGGIISPILANMTLDGLQQELTPEYLMVRYADDFVVLGKDQWSLKGDATGKINRFLSARGRKLNPEKTTYTPIETGFDFLGFNIREYPDVSRMKGTKRGIVLCKPSKQTIMRVQKNIKRIVKDKAPLYVMVTNLNALLRGWANYYRTVSSKKVFSALGAYVWKCLWRRLKKLHPSLPARKLKSRYFITIEGNRWVFRTKDPANKPILLFQMGWVKIKRHTLCESLNPYLPENESYFERRKTRKANQSVDFNKKTTALIKKQKGICPVCSASLIGTESVEVHHRKPRKLGGLDTSKNLVVLHRTCHLQVTHSRSKELKTQWVKEGIIRE